MFIGPGFGFLVEIFATVFFVVAFFVALETTLGAVALFVTRASVCFCGMSITAFASDASDGAVFVIETISVFFGAAVFAICTEASVGGGMFLSCWFALFGVGFPDFHVVAPSGKRIQLCPFCVFGYSIASAIC